MIGHADVRDPGHRETIDVLGKPTGGAILLHVVWCDSCCHLFEFNENRAIILNECPKCKSREIMHPPAYSSMMLEAWCRRRTIQLGLDFSLKRLYVQSERIDDGSSSRELILPPGAKKEEREPYPDSIIRKDELRNLIDWEKINREARKDEGVTGDDTDELIEFSKSDAAYRKRHNIEKPSKIDEAIRAARVDEGPNVDKRYTVIVPGHLAGRGGEA